MTCIVCAHSTAADKTDRERNQTLKAFAELGYVNCLRTEGRAGFRSFDNQCEAFTPLDAKQAETRRRWRAQQTPAA